MWNDQTYKTAQLADFGWVYVSTSHLYKWQRLLSSEIKALSDFLWIGIKIFEEIACIRMSAKSLNHLISNKFRYLRHNRMRMKR